MIGELEAAAADWLKSLSRPRHKAEPPVGQPCANCGAELQGYYCHVCGQSADIHKRSIFHLFWEALEALFHFDGRLWRTMPLLFLLTALVWLAESMRLYFVIEAMGGLHLGLPAIMFVALSSSLLTTVPATPGGLGLVEGGIIGILISPLFAVTKTMAGAVALLDRVINYWSVVVFGLILFLVSKRK